MGDECEEGCVDNPHKHKWEIEPHPYNRANFDVYVTDDDQQALEALRELAESVWDQMEPGGSTTITVRFNGAAAKG